MNPNLWNEIGAFLRDLLGATLSRVHSWVDAHGANVALAILTLALGWLVAAFAGRFLAKLLKASGFDVLLEKFGMQRILARAEITTRPSSLVGKTLYVILLWTTVMLGFDRVGLKAASGLMRSIVGWVPEALVALLLLGLGGLLGKWLGGVVTRAAKVAEIPFHRTIGAIVKWMIILAAAIVAMDQLGIASRSAILIGLIAVGVFIILCGVGLAIFAREPVSNLIAKQLVMREFKPGEEIDIDGVSGIIESFGSTGTRIRGKDQQHLVPHTRLVGSIVRRSA